MEGIIVDIHGYKIPKLPFEVMAYKKATDRFESRKFIQSQCFTKLSGKKVELKISKASSVLNY